MGHAVSIVGSTIHDWARTLCLLRLMGRHAPIMYLHGAPDGFGERWLIQGALVEPAIARRLIDAGYIEDRGATELGANRLPQVAYYPAQPLVATRRHDCPLPIKPE
jgi:hypothetical protein